MLNFEQKFNEVFDDINNLTDSDIELIKCIITYGTDLLKRDEAKKLKLKIAEKKSKLDQSLEIKRNLDRSIETLKKEIEEDLKALAQMESKF